MALSQELKFINFYQEKTKFFYDKSMKYHQNLQLRLMNLVIFCTIRNEKNVTFNILRTELVHSMANCHFIRHICGERNDKVVHRCINRMITTAKYFYSAIQPLKHDHIRQQITKSTIILNSIHCGVLPSMSSTF